MLIRLLAIDHSPQEDEAGCLAACAQMALSYQGLIFSQDQLNRLFGLQFGGVPLSRLHRLQQYEVEVIIRQGNESDLRQAITQNIPPILFVRTNQLSYWQTDTRHAVLLVGYEGEYFFLNDPAFLDAPKRVLLDEVMLAWDEFDNVYALLTR